MKIHMEFNSLAELLNTSRTLAGGLVPPAEPVNKRDKDLPIGASDWKSAYEITYANLERAYERIREFNDLKKNNKVISAECAKLDKKKIAQLEKERQAFVNDSIDNLTFSTRATNCLKAGAIYTITDLLNKTEDDLIQIPNMGKLSIKDIKDVLKANKLKLKG